MTVDALAPHPERKRIGVANVNDRIQLNFGRKYGLKINSQPGKGTTCTLTLPELYADTDVYKRQVTPFVTAHSIHSNALCDAQKDEPSCDKHKK